MKKRTINKHNSQIIIDYINKHQNKDGSYALNQDKNTQTENLTVLATYDALEILMYIDSKNININKIQKWINSEFQSERTTSIQNFSSVYYLTKICNLLSIDYKACNNIILNYYDIGDKYYNSMVSNKNIDLFFFDNFIEFSLLIKKVNCLNNISNSIADFYNSLQKENGLFSLNKDSNADILSTYILLKEQYLFGKSINKKGNLLKTILKLRIPERGFLLYVNYPSTIVDTYYASEILKYYNISVMDYVKKYIDSIDPSKINQHELLYFIELYRECYKTIPIEKLNNNINILNQQLSKNKLQTAKDYLKVIYILRLDNAAGYPVDKIKGSICTTITNSNFSNNSEDNFIVNSLRLIILSLLKYTDKAYLQKCIDHDSDFIKNSHDKISLEDKFLNLYYYCNSIKLFDNNQEFPGSKINVSKTDILRLSQPYLSLQNNTSLYGMYCAIYILKSFKIMDYHI